MIKKSKLNQNRLKTIIFARDDRGRIIPTINPLEAYWSVSCDFALVYFRDDDYPIAEWSRQKMFELGWY